MRALRRLGPVPVVFLGFWLILMVGGRSKLLRDPGTFWHTSVGNKLLHEGFFDGDPFSFTYAGERWVPQQWLGEVAMAAIHRIGGFDTYLVVAAAILAALFTTLTVSLLRTGLHAGPAILLVLTGFAAGALQFHVRPLLFTMVGVWSVAWKLLQYERGKSSLAGLFWFVPLFVIWTNTHGGVLGGWVTLAAAWSGWSVARLIGWPSPIRTVRESAILLMLVMLCAATAFVNPYGWELPRGWWQIMTASRLPELIEEHKRLDPADFASWPLFAFTVVYLFLLAGLRERPRVMWLLPIIWLLQSFLRVRHGPLFAIVGLVAIIDFFPRTRWAEWLQQKRPDLYDPARGSFPLPRLGSAVCVAFLACVLTLHGLNVDAPIVGRGWARFDRQIWPVELIPLLRQHEPQPGEPNRMLNSCNLGGFVIYYGPGYRVLIDDRAELYGEEFLMEVVAADQPDRAAQAIQTWQQKYGEFAFALVTPESRFAAVLLQHPEWKLLGQSPAAMFFQRKR